MRRNLTHPIELVTTIDIDNSLRMELCAADVQALTPEGRLPVDIAARFWLIQFLPPGARSKVTRRSIEGVALVVQTMKEMFERKELIELAAVQACIDGMDEEVRRLSGFDELLEIGGSVRDILRGVLERTKFEQWHDLPFILGLVDGE